MTRSAGKGLIAGARLAWLAAAGEKPAAAKTRHPQRTMARVVAIIYRPLSRDSIAGEDFSLAEFASVKK
jgi:hypothetical protein